MTAEIKEIHHTRQTSWSEFTDGFVIRTYVTESSAFCKHGAEVLHQPPLPATVHRTFKGTTYSQIHRTPSPNSGEVYAAYRQAYDWLIAFAISPPSIEVPTPIDPKSHPQPPTDLNELYTQEKEPAPPKIKLKVTKDFSPQISTMETAIETMKATDFDGDEKQHRKAILRAWDNVRDTMVKGRRGKAASWYGPVE